MKTRKIKIPNKIIKQRILWTMNPVTRVKPSDKAYKRKKVKIEEDD